MKSILKYILKNGIRDRLYLGLILSLVIAFCLSIFLGDTMYNEIKETASVYVAGSSRIIFAVGIMLFVCLTVNSSFENKEIDFIISKSISRQEFIIAYILGFFLAILLVFIPFSIILFLITKCNLIGLIYWSITTFLEMSILICFSLVASLILKNSLSAIMSSFGFYIISRLMGVFVMAIQIPDDVSIIQRNLIGYVLKAISVFFPRLDLFSQSSWLPYGVQDFSMIKIIFLQSAIYIPLLIFMAFHDFRKKQF